MNTRMDNALNSFRSVAINVDLAHLGRKINELIQDVGQLYMVTAGDLQVFHNAAGIVPSDVVEAMANGTKFFDAVYYFAVEAAVRPATLAPTGPAVAGDAITILTKNRLLWTAIFLMLRGSYPESVGSALGTDIPSFLVNICGMNESPAAVAAGLASFNLRKISPEWIRSITWGLLAAPIRQRLALGLAGYRQLGPFRLYECKPDATAEARAAFDWVRVVCNAPPDYDVLSCTRSPQVIARLGSWNKALGNLMLECFTPAQIAEMVANKIIFQVPVRSPQADTWRSWVSGGVLPLAHPIGL